MEGLVGLAYEKLIEDRPELFKNEEYVPIRVLTDKKSRQEIEEKTGKKTGIVYEDDYILLLRDAVQFSSGSYGTYLRVFNKGMHGGTVVLPVTKSGKVLLVRHFRHTSRSYHYELPRGMATEGYTNDENARKELKEETNAEPITLTFLGEAYPDSGLLGHKVAFYHAQISESDLKINDVDEGITEFLLIPYKELKDRIARGEIQDGFTLTALYLAEIKGAI